MMLLAKDKVLHIVACFLITAVTFLLLMAARRVYDMNHTSRYGEEMALPVESHDVEAVPDGYYDNDNTITTAKHCCFDQNVHKYLLFIAISTLVALVVGIAKEIGDMYNFWWLCQTKKEDGSIVGCDASWADFLADVVGIILANAFIFAFLWVWGRFHKRDARQSDYMMAGTSQQDTCDT
eukprot:scaffold59790_cov83-Cyclotella_meneghiniana.AAC.3